MAHKSCTTIRNWLRGLLNNKYQGKDLADLLSCSNSSISRIKTGKKKITHEWIHEHRTDLLALAMVTGNTEIRNLLFAMRDEELDEKIIEQVTSGGLFVPVNRRDTVNPHKRKSTPIK